MYLYKFYKELILVENVGVLLKEICVIWDFKIVC